MILINRMHFASEWDYVFFIMADWRRKYFDTVSRMSRVFLLADFTNAEEAMPSLFYAACVFLIIRFANVQTNI